MKCLNVFAVNTMDISFVFNIPELVPSSVSSPQAKDSLYCIGSKDINEGKKGNSRQCLGI